MTSTVSLRTTVPGRETLPGGFHAPRHRHLEPYALVAIAGAFEQTGYAGRLIASPGDLLVQPTLDSHANRLLTDGAQILRLPWPHVAGAGRLYHLRDLDALVRTAARDIREAAEMAREEVARSEPVATPPGDWPDLLARDICERRVTRLADWAIDHGLATETLSRGFTRLYGVPPARFRAEWRTRDAWLRVVDTRDSFAAIAAATGFADQSHMTRSITELTGAAPSRWRRPGPVPRAR